MNKKQFIIKMCLGAMLSMATLTVSAQNRVVKGKVVDETGDPVMGATVVVEGSIENGVITDIDGNYTITISGKKNLVISFIGYTTQTITDLNQKKVVLKEDAQQLDEVVVVGYGVQKKAHLTGAIATVTMDDIQDLSGAGLASSLGGMVNGMSVSGGQSRPGENAKIYIRDTNSFGEVGSVAQEPLYVIDGYIYPDDIKIGNTRENLGAQAFNNLDPSVIESISVLKDAAAAVYGARAANGVILVTTKKGKAGAPQISYGGSFGFTDEISRPKMLSAYDYGRLYNTWSAGDPINTSLNLKTDLYQADELEAMKGLNYDLLDKYWKTGFTQKHSINISGGSEKANYFAGVSYFDQDGNLGDLEYNRWNYRAGVDVKISKWLKANLTVSGDYGKKNKPNVKVGGSSDEKDYNLLLTRPGYIPETVNGLPISALGITNSAHHDNQTYSFSVLQNNGDYNRNMNSNMSINSSLSLDMGFVKSLKGLELRFSYGKSISTDKNNQYGSNYSIYRMVNRTGSGNHLYTPVEGQAYDDLMTEDNFIVSTIANGSPSYLQRSTTRSDSYQMNFSMNYSRSFGDHTVGGLFSIERSEAESEYLMGKVNEPYEFTTGQSNSAVGEKNTVFSRSESGSLSYIGRVNYAYQDKYLAEVLFRSDSSTKFAPENYWGFFPSMSLGWIVSQEKFMRLKWVEYLKIRGSFGLTGRDNTAPWQWMQIYSTEAGKGPVFGTTGNIDASKPISINKNNSAVNRNVHWDKSYKANFGIDFTTLSNRLAFNIDAYYTWNREMLMNIEQTVPTTVGTQSAAVNLGEMNNYGIEISATWRDRIGKDFKYKIGINTSYSDNKVLVMDFEKEYLYRQITKGSRSDIGAWGMQCMGMFRSFQDIEEFFNKYNITDYMGLTKDKVRPGMLIYKDVRGAQQPDGTYAAPDGIVDKDNDQVHLSNRSNPWGFTTNLSAEWKGISISAQLSASWGGYSFIPGQALKPGNSIEYTNMPSFWKPDNVYVYEDIYDASGNLVMSQNREASLPNLKYSDINAVTSSFWRVNGTRVTLNRITLAYALPKQWIKKIGLSSCRFNITGQNLLSLYNPYPDNFMDPQCSYGSYPKLRKFTIGVNVGF
ncbi:TonB-dependent receptor [Bacteroides sp. GM023]|uniref:SusC/RagA family TonB-linked outer membrane protein n=1 Tax=Bacteroides sp. GM023 TaxID=2723058 RepID=UPI00168C0B4A|nr:TonB-dependent receptor [Bacteroides sp. GM023]MBD3592642.1 TonB-dependent receptor [Bacteroides sp. GM023]